MALGGVNLAELSYIFKNSYSAMFMVRVGHRKSLGRRRGSTGKKQPDVLLLTADSYDGIKL